MCYNAAIVSIIFKTLLTGEAFPDKIQKPVVRNLSLRNQAGKYDINMEHSRLDLTGDRNLTCFQLLYDL